MKMRLDQKNFGRLTEAYIIVIGIAVVIAITGIVAFGLLLVLKLPWFSVPLIFVFLGLWIAASQWNELSRLRIVAGFASSITRPASISTAAHLLNLRKSDFVHNLGRLITRGVIEIDIFPEVDAFGPKGAVPSKSVLEPNQVKTFTQAISNQPFTTTLQWIGLIGTIIAIIYHVIGLIRFLGFF